MLKIIKDINICYDGIRLVKLKEGQDLDVKSLLPNPEKAKVFRNRLIDLNVAVEPKETAIETAKEEPKEAEKQKSKGKGKKKETAKEEPKEAE